MNVNLAIAKIMRERSFIHDWRFMWRELSWPRRCPHCNDWSITVKRRHNTFRYVEDDSLNWNTFCWECMTEVWDYAADLWDTYHSEVM